MINRGSGETSCIIPCHNYGRYLRQSLESALSQTLPFKEVILVDDASTDDTPQIAQEYAARGVKCVRVEFKNQSKSRMAGFNMSMGTFILFHDADNIMTPNFHEALSKTMWNAPGKVGVVYGKLQRFDDQGNDCGPHPCVGPFDRIVLRRRNMADLCALIKREALYQAGGLSDVPVFIDWVLWRRMERLGWDLLFEPKAVLRYRKHPGQITRENVDNWEGFTECFKEASSIAAVTLFSGRQWAFNSYLRFWQNVMWKLENVTIVAVDNSRDLKFGLTLKTVLRDLEDRKGIKHILIKEDRRIQEDESAAQFADDRQARTKHAKALNEHLAALYATARSHIPIGCDHVFFLEDDIEPPPNALASLMMILHRKEDIGMVTGVVKSRFRDGYIFKDMLGADTKPPPPGQFLRASHTGFHCAMVRRELLDTFAFRASIERDKGPYAYDWAACADIQALRKDVAVSGDVYCKHWQADGTWV